MSNYIPNSTPPEDRPYIPLTPRELSHVDAEAQREIDLLGPPPSYEDEVQRELDLLGPPPTVESLRQQGHTEVQWLIWLLTFISGAGRVLTLIVAEAIQSVAAVLIAIVFGLLELQRVYHGAVALGQDSGSSGLIAFAVVVANVVHPIYSLRGLRGQASLTITHMTARGHLDAFWQRLVGKPSSESVDLYHNPGLHVAASIITWSTIMLAVYDLLAPLLTEFVTGSFTTPVPIALLKLVMGSTLSIAGVFFLQAAAHEIGVRILADQPQRLVDVLQVKLSERAALEAQLRHDARARVDDAQAVRQQQITEIHERIRGQYQQWKIQQVAEKKPSGPEVSPLVKAPATNGHYTNGNGNGHHA